MIEEIYGEFYTGLLQACTAMTGNRTEAEDLCQETYLRALGHLDELEALKSGQRRAWLRKTARNLWIDKLRKEKRETYPGQEELELAAFEEDFTRGEVGLLLNRLPPEEGALFRMRYFEGYNATELGEMFRLPPGTVRSRLSSARRRLKQWMEE